MNEQSLSIQGARAEDVLMRCPTCGISGQKAWIRRNCGLETSEQRLTLSDWRTPALSAARKAQRVQARDAMEQALKDRAGLLTFWGDFGSGKTLAMQIVVNELREMQVIDGYYAPFAAILNHLRVLYNQRQGSSEYWQRLLDVPALALDEVTRFRADSQWQQEQLFVLVDTRYRRRHSHLTLFATNDDPRQSLPPDEALGYLYSRMREGALVHLEGDVRHIAGGNR